MSKRVRPQELFPFSHMETIKKQAIESRVKGLLVQDPALKEQFKHYLESKGKKVKKELPTIEEIIERMRRYILDTNFLEGLSSEGIGVVSASKLTTYRGCHFAYLMQYILHLDPPIYFPQIVVGEKIHLVLQDFNNGKFSTEKEILTSWKSRWYSAVNSRNMLFHSEDEPHIIYRLGLRTLKKFWQQEHDKPKPQFVELSLHPYNLTMSGEIGITEEDPVTGIEKIVESILVSYPITGKLDKIDIKRENNKTTVIITDYKTGQVGEMQSDFDIQPTLYNYAYMELSERFSDFPKPDELKVVFHSIPVFCKGEPEFQTIEAERSEADFMYLLSESHNANTGIRNKNFTPFMGARHCDKICFYKQVCHQVLMANNKELFRFLVSQYHKKVARQQT